MNKKIKQIRLLIKSLTNLKIKNISISDKALGATYNSKHCLLVEFERKQGPSFYKQPFNDFESLIEIITDYLQDKEVLDFHING